MNPGRINRLVAITFIPNPLNKETVNHINGIKSDNRLENLEWATVGENIRHAITTGLKIGVRGERSNLAKLSKKSVLKIRSSNAPLKVLSKKYNVSDGLISMIRNNKVWKHL